MKIERVELNDNLSVTESVEPGKIKIIILDGNQGKVSKCNAVNHGYTIIETVNGKAKRIKFEEYELL